MSLSFGSIGGLCICLSKKTAVAAEFWDSWKVSRSLGGKSVNVSHDNVIKSFYPSKQFIKVSKESIGRGKRWDEGGGKGRYSYGIADER